MCLLRYPSNLLLDVRNPRDTIFEIRKPRENVDQLSRERLVETKFGMLRRDGCSSIKGISEIRAVDPKRALTLRVFSLSFLYLCK